MTASGPPVVLVVEDEPDVAETYRLWLAHDYEVRVADSVPVARRAIDGSVDVVLLDRMRSGRAGDEVLAWLQGSEYDVGVAVVSALGPDGVEHPADRYLDKPATRDGIRDTVAELCGPTDY